MNKSFSKGAGAGFEYSSDNETLTALSNPVAKDKESTAIKIGSYTLSGSFYITDVDENIPLRITKPAGRRVSVFETFKTDGTGNSTAYAGELSFKLKGTVVTHPVKKNSEGIEVEDTSSYTVPSKLAELRGKLTANNTPKSVSGCLFNSLGVKKIIITSFHASQKATFLNEINIDMACREYDDSPLVKEIQT